MLIKTIKSIPSSEITDQVVFSQRRALLKSAMATAVLAASPNLLAEQAIKSQARKNQSDSLLTPTSSELVKNYTNYYEFTFNKEDATRLAQSLPTDDWSVNISGEVESPAKFQLEDIIASIGVQEYIYRFRCVEAWSMVVPWQGFPLSELLKKVKPLSSAKFVKFTTVYNPEVMPKQRDRVMLDWPYIEGLRIDEAMHPLSILAIGMYDEKLPKQNGAPLRLVVPWKYGFKSIKAVTHIELTRNQPLTTWNRFAPDEYGFYGNVNPEVPHPRWSQRSERQLGSGYFTPRRITELFNGYGDQVAGLYSDLDLRRFF